MCKATAAELIEVVKYWRDWHDSVFQVSQAARTETAMALMKLGVSLLKPWGDGS